MLADMPTYSVRGNIKGSVIHVHEVSVAEFLLVFTNTLSVPKRPEDAKFGDGSFVC